MTLGADSHTAYSPDLTFETAVETRGDRRILLIVITPDSGILVWTPSAIDMLDTFVSSLDVTGIDAIAFTAAGRVFGAGADLKDFLHVTEREDAIETAARAYRAFAGISALPVPTFSLINGAALGGGYEFALRTDYRVAADSVSAIGLPEVNLGLIPGWGGVTLLNDVVGPEQTAATAVLDSIANRSANAARALRTGLVDAVLPTDNFVSAGLDWAARVLDGRESPAAAVQVPTPFDPEQVRARVAKRIPTPLSQVEAVLELIARSDRGEDRPAFADRTADRLARFGSGEHQVAEAYTIETFADLLLTDEARASIYAFFALQSVTKRARPGTKTPPITEVGVVGGGLMATQLAVVFATKLGARVRIAEVDEARAAAAQERVNSLLEAAEQRGSLTADARADLAARITASASKADLADSEIVIEAVFEDLEVKRQVWREVEAVVGPDTVLLTNTSSLLVSEQAQALERPERLVGFHFFNPVAVLPLVELIFTERTSEATADTARALAKGLGKTGIVVGDHPAFLVNRLLSRLFADVLTLIDSGADVPTVDNALTSDGLPMTPLTLLDYVGHAVQLHIFETLHDHWPERFPVSASLDALVAQQQPGQPRLRYLEKDGSVTAVAQAAIDAARAGEHPSLAQAPGLDATSVTAGQARTLLLTGLADEVSRILADGTAAHTEDIDAAMILGANYPRHIGGIIPLLDRSGASVLATGDFLLDDGIANVPGDRTTSTTNDSKAE